MKYFDDIQVYLLNTFSQRSSMFSITHKWLPFAWIMLNLTFDLFILVMVRVKVVLSMIYEEYILSDNKPSKTLKNYQTFFFSKKKLRKPHMNQIQKLTSSKNSR